MGTRLGRWAGIAAASLVAAASLGAVPLVTAAPAAAQGPGLQAGVGMGDITPPVGTPMFAYTAREAVVSGVVPFLTQESFDTGFYAKTFLATVGIHTRLKARAVVLEQAGTKLAMVQVDLGGMPYELHQAVVARIASTGIDRDHLMIGVTHSHGSVGPIWPATHSGYQILGGDLYDPRVFGLVADGIAAAVLAADASLEPARAAIVRTEVADASRNRSLDAYLRNTDRPASDRPDHLPHSIPSELTVLRVDTAGGRPLGVWSTFAIHGTSFGADMLHFTGDNQAWSERLVEDGIRARAGLGPDDLVVHAQANGAEGDISPRGAPLNLAERPGSLPPLDLDAEEDTVWVRGQMASAEMAGTRVARAVLAAWEAAEPLLTDDVELAARFTLLNMVDLDVNGEPVGVVVALGCAGVVCPDGTALPVDLPGQGAKLPLLIGPPGLLVPAFAALQAVQVGDQLFVAVPFEVTSQMGTRIELAADRAARDAGLAPGGVAMVGLANAYQSYMSTPEEYDHHGYEGSFTLYGRQQGPLVQAGIAELVAALAGGTPAPAGVPEPPYVDLTLPLLPPLTPEPGPGTPVSQPQDIARFGQATFSWQGGDPTPDDPVVRVEIVDGDGWRAVTRGDSLDTLTTHRGNGPHVWTEVWEATACAATGTHRFVVSGATASGAYEVVSDTFEVTSAAGPEPDRLTVLDGAVHLRGVFPPPDDGERPLRARTRLAEGGAATLRIDGVEVAAPWDAGARRYQATGAWAAGADVEVLGIADGCGNGAAADTVPEAPAAPAAPTGTGPPDPGPGTVTLPATGGGAVPVAALLAVGAALAVRLAGRRRAA